MRSTQVSRKGKKYIYYVDRLTNQDESHIFSFVDTLVDHRLYIKALGSPPSVRTNVDLSGHSTFFITHSTSKETRTIGAVIVRDDHLVSTIVHLSAKDESLAKQLVNLVSAKASTLGYAYVGIPLVANVSNSALVNRFNIHMHPLLKVKRTNDFVDIVTENLREKGIQTGRKFVPAFDGIKGEGRKRKAIKEWRTYIENEGDDICKEEQLAVFMM